jgi:hypothetical protein
MFLCPVVVLAQKEIKENSDLCLWGRPAWWWRYKGIRVIDAVYKGKLRVLAYMAESMDTSKWQTWQMGCLADWACHFAPLVLWTLIAMGDNIFISLSNLHWLANSMHVMVTYNGRKFTVCILGNLLKIIVSYTLKQCFQKIFSANIVPIFSRKNIKCIWEGTSHIFQPSYRCDQWCLRNDNKADPLPLSFLSVNKKKCTLGSALLVTYIIVLSEHHNAKTARSFLAIMPNLA